MIIADASGEKAAPLNRRDLQKLTRGAQRLFGTMTRVGITGRDDVAAHSSPITLDRHDRDRVTEPRCG
jgi:hypothetical protein